MSEYKLLNIEKRGHLAIVTMMGEGVNALTNELVAEIYGAFTEMAEDGDIWAVVLCSGRKLFAAGANLKDFIDQNSMENVAVSAAMQRAFLAVEQFPHPVVAAVNGVAFGGGLELALSCDLRVFDSGTKVAFPECGLGITPGAGGTQRLNKLIGVGRAKRLIFTGEVIRGEEALAMGICEYYEAEGSCLDKAIAVAETICSKAPKAVAVCKKSINFSMEHKLEEGLLYERYEGCALFDSEDKREGIGAFLEKRTPVFKNR